MTSKYKLPVCPCCGGSDGMMSLYARKDIHTIIYLKVMAERHFHMEELPILDLIRRVLDSGLSIKWYEEDLKGWDRYCLNDFLRLTKDIVEERERNIANGGVYDYKGNLPFANNDPEPEPPNNKNVIQLAIKHDGGGN